MNLEPPFSSDHTAAARPSCPERVLVVGCGYVGAAFVREARTGGIHCYALTRNQARFDELRLLGAEPVLGHWLDPASLRDLPAVSRVLVSIPHRDDCQAGVETHVRGLQQLLKALPVTPERLIYLSTTGVYGDVEGETVDELTPVAPSRLATQIAVAAERWLNGHVPQAVVLRLAGIYGRGRLPLAAQLRAGDTLAVPGTGHLNLVHVDDIARMLMVLFAAELRHSLYVFSDGQPVRREDFYRYLADLCGVSNPRFAPPDSSSGRARRASDKRVDPTRILAETDFNFRFATYRQGLVDALSL